MQNEHAVYRLTELGRFSARPRAADKAISWAKIRDLLDLLQTASEDALIKVSAHDHRAEESKPFINYVEKMGWIERIY